MDAAAANGDGRRISGEGHSVSSGDGGTWEVQAAVPAMREQDSADQICGERDELLCDLPDGREIVGGQGVFALVEGRLAADVGRIGDADEGEEGSATGASSQREVRGKDNPESQLEFRQVDCVNGREKPQLAGSNLCLTAINEELDCI